MNGRQLGVARGAVASEIPRDGLERPPALDHGPVGPEDAHLRAVALEHQPGIPAEDREARDLLRPLDALQEEARREVPEAQVGGDRGLEIGEELSRDGQDVGRPAPPGPGARGGASDGSARLDIDGSFRSPRRVDATVAETKRAGLAGTVPLTSALPRPARYVRRSLRGSRSLQGRGAPPAPRPPALRRLPGGAAVLRTIVPVTLGALSCRVKSPHRVKTSVTERGSVAQK